eukprot:TRINITY_DN4487_c0_g1_i1.p1 TRINITY_DN4487_c0_g1~~TRINITY_DN4487_c0_g1_i1.p1  ORF type:complete len:1423 (+),score=446.40 TRINITY_DN4487_c0_g1_i1:37-4305(+)
MRSVGEQRGGSESDGRVGKEQILRWASEVTGEPCSRFQDLRNGVVPLRVFAAVLPGIANLNALQWCRKPTSDVEARRNFDILEQLAEKARLPEEALDREGVKKGAYAACWHFLATMYFLFKLATEGHYRVAFRRPIDGSIVDFLGSQDSIDLLASSGVRGPLREYASNASWNPPSMAEPSEPPEHRSGPPAPTARSSAPSFGFGQEVQIVDMDELQLTGTRGRVRGEQESVDGVRILVQAQRGNILVPPEKLVATGPAPKQDIALPPVGQEVEVATTCPQQELHGARGHVAAQLPAAGGHCLLVECAPPHPPGPMVIRPEHLLPVLQEAASKPRPEVPPVGCTVEAVGIGSQPNLAALDGLVGTVVGHMPDVDGMRALVRFHSQGPLMNVSPANLKVVPTPAQEFQPPQSQPPQSQPPQSQPPHSQPLQSQPPQSQPPHSQPPQSQSQQFQSQPQSQQFQSQPLQAQQPHSQLPQAQPAQSVTELADLEPRQSVADTSQPMYGRLSMRSMAEPSDLGRSEVAASRDGVDRAQIRTLKLKQENELLVRELRQREARATYLEQQLTRAGIPFASATPRPSSPLHTSMPGAEADGGELLWRDPRSKQKGEALVAKLRFELESLRRQLVLAGEEAESAKREAARQQKASRLALQHSQMQLDEHCSKQLALADARAREDLLQQRAHFTAELRRVVSEVKFEADRARGGFDEPVEALEEELLRLRQQRVSQEQLITAMDSNNASLRELAAQCKGLAKLHRDQHTAASERCQELLLALLPGGDRGGSTLGAAPAPLQLLLSDESMSSEAAHSSVAAYVRQQLEHLQQQGETSQVALSNDLLAFVVKTQQLRQQLHDLRIERDRATESLSAHLPDASAALHHDYDREQKLSEAEEEVKKLRAKLEYLRERDQHVGRESVRDPDQQQLGSLTIPSATVADATDSPLQHGAVDTLCGQIHEALRSRDWECLEKHFWILVANQCALQQRVASLADTVRGMHQNERQAEGRRLADTDSAVQAARAEERQRMQGAAAVELTKEKAGVEVALRLAEEQLRDTREELRRVLQQRSVEVEFAAQQEQQRLQVADRRARAATASANRGMMREQLLVQLCTTYREISRAEPDLRARAELEVEGLRQQLQQLPALALEDAVPRDAEVERLVSDATEALKSHVTAALREHDTALARAARCEDAQRAAEAAAGALRLQLDSLEQRRRSMETESAQHQEEVASLQRQFRETRAAEDASRRQMEDRLRALQSEISEVPVYVDIRNLLSADRKRRAPQQHEPAAAAAAPAAAPVLHSRPYDLLRSEAADRGPTVLGSLPPPTSPPRPPRLTSPVRPAEACTSVPAVQLASVTPEFGDLDSAISAAREQLSSMFPSREREQRPPAATAARSISGATQPTTASRLSDDDEFARQQQQLLDSFRCMAKT